jgi:hypothetical protein
MLHRQFDGDGRSLREVADVARSAIGVAARVGRRRGVHALRSASGRACAGASTMGGAHGSRCSGSAASTDIHRRDAIDGCRSAVATGESQRGQSSKREMPDSPDVAGRALQRCDAVPYGERRGAKRTGDFVLANVPIARRAGEEDWHPTTLCVTRLGGHRDATWNE